jgi:hypothetical protein
VSVASACTSSSASALGLTVYPTATPMLAIRKESKSGMATHLRAAREAKRFQDEEGVVDRAVVTGCSVIASPCISFSGLSRFVGSTS